MGLDIVAYSNVEKIDNPVENEYGYIEDAVKAYVLGDFDRSLRGLEDGAWYRSTDESDEVSFRAGSYSGYNLWRDSLAQIALGIPANNIWADPDKYKDEPFFELINFADNEGTIGPIAARDLAMDFVTSRDDIERKAKEHFTTDEGDVDWFMQKYDDWTEACEIASHDGLILFC
jgi:hypothetical protein